MTKTVVAITETTNTRSFNLRVFGCQMNSYDGELIRGAFSRAGYREELNPEAADVVLFHTCSVREHAEERVHSLLGALKRTKRERPHVVLGVVGCMADRESEELFEREPHVDLVCGSRHFPKLPKLVEKVISGEGRVLLVGDSDFAVDAPVRDLAGHPGGFSSQVAIMRGCDLNCSFCIVPSVRGRVESRPIKDILDECRRLVERGTTEISLLGHTIDSYGVDLSSSGSIPQLARLLDELAEVEGLRRIRLITLHPAYCNDELVEALARSPQFMRFLPIPLQSGSDSVLKRMKRGYTLDLYRKRIQKLREKMPDLELVSDWIVGFPGETERDFEASVDAMKEFGFLHSYVFQYSPRPGTPSTQLEDDVPAQEKGRRNRLLLDLQAEIARERTSSQVGKAGSLMLDLRPEKNPGYWRGKLQTGHSALLPDPDGLLRPGLQIPVQIQDWQGKELFVESVLSQKKVLEMQAKIPTAQVESSILDV